jgi:hypothetical protein
MIADRELLKQALDELVRLKPCAADPTRYLAQLYTSALAEWANRLGMRPPDLNKLILIGEMIPPHRFH